MKAAVKDSSYTSLYVGESHWINVSFITYCKEFFIALKLDLKCTEAGYMWALAYDMWVPKR